MKCPVYIQIMTLPEVTDSEQTFNTMMNHDQLWTPSHKDHAHWITVLVTKLLLSSGVHDNILRLLEPVCKVKVSYDLLTHLLVGFCKPW